MVAIEQEFSTLKQDAIRRVREMERRSENYIQREESSGAPKKSDGKQNALPPQQHAPNQRPTSQPQQNSQSQPPQSRPANAPHSAQAMPPAHTNMSPTPQSPQNRHSQPPPLGIKGLDGLIPNIKIDQDKIILIALGLVLFKNGADIKLLLALGYLLM